MSAVALKTMGAARDYNRRGGAVVPIQPDENGRPIIFLCAGGLPGMVDRAEEALLGHCETLGLFQRGGELVRVICLPEVRKGGGLRRSRGTIQLEPLSRVALTEVFDRIAEWQKFGGKEPEVIDCPDKIAKIYLSRSGSWRVPVLTGIISGPIMREDGTILSQSGYDKDTGLFLVSEKDWLAIPERPTLADAKAALKILRRPFEEFPFVTQEDVAVHIAAILTAIQRRLLAACPVFGYSAPAQRSGKSMLAEAVAILTTGKPAPATGFSGDPEETRKSITSALREGHLIVNLDNIEVPLASPDLARAITQREYQDRLLGQNKMLRLPTNVLWTATGNNLVCRGDLSSRTLLCRIDSGVERPEARTFRIPHLQGYLRKNRRRLVAAALTILRAYHVAGRPRQQVQPWGGFDDWSASIREPLIWAGLPDLCKTRETILADDPEREESLAILQSLQKTFEGRVFTTKMIVDRCASDEALKSSILSVAAGRQPGDAIDNKRLGWWCRGVKDRIIGGLRLLHLPIKASGSTRWRIVECKRQG